MKKLGTAADEPGSLKPWSLTLTQAHPHDKRNAHSTERFRARTIPERAAPISRVRFGAVQHEHPGLLRSLPLLAPCPAGRLSGEREWTQERARLHQIT